MEQNLRVEELQLKIGRVSINPRNAINGKIQLTHPYKGRLHLVVNEDNLTQALSAKSFLERLEPMQGVVEDKPVPLYVRSVKCALLTDGKIALNSEVMLKETGETKALAFTAIPGIAADGQCVVLQTVHSETGKEVPAELTTALGTQVSQVLNLRHFEKKGTSVKIHHLDVMAGHLTLQAIAHIDQFPSS